MNDLVRIVEAKEAARDAAGGNRPAATAAAASFYKKSARPETASKPQPAQPRGSPLNGARPKKARCRCGNEFANFAASVAATSSGGQVFEPPLTGCLPPREARISSAAVSRASARLSGQGSNHSNHPRLEVLMSFATPGGLMDLKVKDAVADSGSSYHTTTAQRNTRIGPALRCAARETAPEAPS